MTEQHAAPRPHRTLRRVITALMAAALTLTMAGPAPGALPSVPVQTALINRTASSLTVLVNKTYPLSPLTYVPAQLTTVDGFQMRPETATAWSRLKKDAAARGYSLRMVSAYRSYSYQRDLYHRYVQQYGRAHADRISARPGHSEHQTGLAIDIGLSSGSCQLTSCFGDTAAGKWVAANAWRYGLILRYPQGTESVTGYMDEPWHFRYVGPSLAAELKTRSITLLERYYDGRNPSVTTDASLVYAIAGQGATRNATFRGGYRGARSIPLGVPSDVVAAFTADWDVDGLQDVLMQRRDGTLVLRLGRRGGGFGGGVVVARGLTGRQLTVGRWASEGRDRLISVSSTGTVYRHTHSTGPVTGSTVIGRVAAPREVFLARLDGNSSMDLGVVDRNGTLRAYPSSSTRTLTGTSRVMATGWNSSTALHVVQGFDGPGTQTLLARRPSNGLLHARTLSSTGTLGAERGLVQGLASALIFR